MFHNPGDDWHPGLEGISKVYFIPCFAIRFPGIWYLFSFIVCFPEGNVWWTSQWPGYLESASWGDTPGVAVAMLSGICFRRFFTFYHGKSPFFTTNWGTFFYFFQASWPCKSKLLRFCFNDSHWTFYTETCVFFGGGLSGIVLLRGSLQILDLWMWGDVFHPIYNGVKKSLLVPTHLEQIWRLRVDQCPTTWWQLKKYLLIFTPKIGKDEPILTSIFFKGVENTN